MAAKLNPYAIIPPAVMRHLPACSRSARDAAVALATQMGQRGYRVVGQEELAGIVGKSVRSIKYGLKELRDLNLIFVTPEGRKNRYRWNAAPEMVQASLPFPDARVLRFDRAPDSESPAPTRSTPPGASVPTDCAPASGPGQATALTGASDCPIPDPRPRQVTVTTGASPCPGRPACKDARAEATNQAAKENLPPHPPADESGGAPGQPPGGGGGNFMSDEDRALVADFVRHFADEFRRHDFDRPEVNIEAFALRLPVPVDTPIAERLIMTHALLLAFAAMTDKTRVTTARRMMGIAVKTPDILTDARRRRARDFIRNRNNPPPASVSVVCPEPEPERFERKIAPGRMVCAVDCGYANENPLAFLVEKLAEGDARTRTARLWTRCPKCGADTRYEPPVAAAGGA